MTALSDDFNRANSTDLGSGWVEVSGDWSITSNQLSPGAAGGTIILRAATPMASNDHYAQVTIAATTAASQGVWCRGNTNISNGYLWRNDGTSWNLFAVVGGGFTIIGTYTAPAAPGDIAKVQAVGTTIKGYVNGIERVSVTDTSVATGTNVGIRSESASALRYDNFAAADITSGTTLALPTATESGAAQLLTSRKTGALGTAGGAETGQTLAGVKMAALTTALVVEAAQTSTGSKTGTLTGGGETETGQGLAGGKTAVLEPAAVTEVGSAITGARTGLLSTATVTVAAQALIAAAPATPLPTSTITTTAQLLTGVKTAHLTPAIEHAAARALVRQSTVTPSPERTYRIPAENRRVTVAAESRTTTVR